MIYANIVETVQQGELGYNLEIVGERANEFGVDEALSMTAEEEIASKFEIEGDPEVRVFHLFQIQWWLAQHSFIPTGRYSYYLTKGQFQR